MTTDTPRWFTSSYSSNGGNCVRVATNLVASRGVVPVSDSKIKCSPMLDFPADAFSSFVGAIKAGQFGVG
ncbi:DUF397 domain-containing protein [Streptomyces sp. HUAS TT20]|uniref:DUF397 domain-containing protein n=1 Tax=Streptomyces sp. HUAS TT20 TaxID=3447509 RepID=UPI0021DAB462|nr:DUF397 domain-containing protein [Streptomyces sp. HUAS 15-9]UXY29465.1 DUF397 domain-containing protein [Streptomyces sp. HUAS 15-9]